MQTLPICFVSQSQCSEKSEVSHYLEDCHLSKESAQGKHSVDGSIRIKAYEFQNISKRNLTKRIEGETIGLRI